MGSVQKLHLFQTCKVCGSHLEDMRFEYSLGIAYPKIVSFRHIPQFHQTSFEIKLQNKSG
jgi:hypothetical protein